MQRPIPMSFEELSSFEHLIKCARRAARGHTRSAEVASFLIEIEPHVLRLQNQLRHGAYRPAPWRTFRIRDPKPRTISAAAFPDRVVHHALCSAIEDVLTHDALPTSFACRKGGGVLRALKCAQRLARRSSHVLKLDIRHFFETMDHEVLRRLLWRRIHDPAIRRLLNVFIDAGAPGSEVGRGLPIGNLTSQHFANFYLGPLDRHITRGLGAAGLVRYMDDLLVFGNSRSELWQMAKSITEFTECRLNVALKDEVTRLMPVSEGVPYLGFIIWPAIIRFDPVRKRRWLRKMNALTPMFDLSFEHERHAELVAASLVGWSLHGDTHRLRQSWVQRHSNSD